MAGDKPLVVSALEEALGRAAVSTDPDDLISYGRDWTRAFPPDALAVVRPGSTEEVARVVSICRAHKQAMVPSGGRTGLAAAAVATRREVVVSLERMNHIGQVDVFGGTVEVEAGAVTEAVHQACRPHGLFWPIDLAAKGQSQIGGNLSTNAGGVRVIRYGHARHWVLGMTVVLATGEIAELGGAIEKDNTGTDLRQLFIGSEGTLGIICKATLKLTRLPEGVHVVVLGLRNFATALELLAEARRAPFGLAAFEVWSDRAAARLARHRQLRPPVRGECPWYALIEIASASPEQFESWAEEVLSHDGVVDGTVAQSASQARDLWQLREGISESLSATGVPHKNDVTVPVSRLPTFIDEVEKVFEHSYPGWDVCLFGHAGDGNIHINVMKPDDMSPAEFYQTASATDHRVFELVAAHGGSISAEHGIGLVKKPYLHYSRSDLEVDLMRRIKRALDPDLLLNPGKVFDP